MYHMTSEDFRKIEEFNGKLNSRYEYLDAIAEALNTDTVGIRHGMRDMKGIALDEHTELDCRCRTVKGQMIVKDIWVTHREYERVNGETNLVRYESESFVYKRKKWYREILGEWIKETHSFEYTYEEM